MKLPFLITNPKSGEKSVSLTMMVSAYTVLMFWLIFGGVFNISFVREFDAMVFIEVFTPTAALYFGNKLTPKGVAVATSMFAKGATPPKSVAAPHPIDELDDDDDSDENPGG